MIAYSFYDKIHYKNVGAEISESEIFFFRIYFCMLKMCKNTLKSMNELDHRILVLLEQPRLRSLM